MCCIFTCCGWMIDLIQRFWTFTMACCISSAVCCALATSAMSGIAMGYNYSLAEYIDLKETNVSVYLKRGVFDDEIADDMDWRRSGHMPVEGHLRDSNLMTGAPENEEMPLRSGRRMEDSMAMSDDQHKFEGSLMRLTVKPPSYKSSIQPVTSDQQIAEVLADHPEGSIDQIKAIHSLLNARRFNNQRNTKTTSTEPTMVIPDINGRRLGGIAPGGVPMNRGPYYPLDPTDINRARLAVPDEKVGNPENWFLPKNQIPPAFRRTMNFEDDYPNSSPNTAFTYPKPIIYTSEMKRPTRPKPEYKPTHSTPFANRGMLRTGVDEELNTNVPDEEIQILKERMLKHKEDLEKLQNFHLRKAGGKSFKSEDDYADQANRGVPIRKKRGLIDKITNRSNINHSDKDETKNYSKLSTILKVTLNNIDQSKHEENYKELHKVNTVVLENSIFTLQNTNKKLTNAPIHGEYKNNLDSLHTSSTVSTVNKTNILFELSTNSVGASNSTNNSQLPEYATTSKNNPSENNSTLIKDISQILLKYWYH